MKCIERSTGIARVSDDLAEKLVKGGMAKYIAKGAWKKQVRETKPVEVAVEVTLEPTPSLAAPKEKIKAKDRKKKERKSKSN